MRMGQRLKLRFSTQKDIITDSDGKILAHASDRGTVTGLRARGEFRVTFDSRDRQRGASRARYWYTPDQVSGFELLGGNS